MTLTRIQYFIEATRYENFTEAARRLYVAQPNLSKQISQLEQELGVQLFYRANRTVRLTAAGRYLFEQLDGLPEKVAAAFEQARALGRGESGSLSVGILEGQEVNDCLLERLQLFHDTYPELELHLERGGFSNLRAGLQNGSYDLILTLSFETDAMADTSSACILQQSGYIAINRKHPLSHCEALSLGQLRNENFVVISPAESPTGYQLFLKQCEAYGFTPNVVRQLSSLESLLLCVEAGIGIALLDKNTRLEYSRDVRLIPIPGSTPVNVSAVWMSNNAMPALKRLIQILKS